MGATLEQVFYETLAEMPSDVSRAFEGSFLCSGEFYANRKSKSYLTRRKQRRRKVQELAT